MAMSKDFVQAWQEWQRGILPISNFRQGRVNAPTYQLEHDLDHLASYLYTLGSKAIGGINLEYSDLAKRELIMLETMDENLEKSGISAEEKTPYMKYIAATRKLLEELSRYSTNVPITD